jgi:hypothetical protein
MKSSSGQRGPWHQLWIRPSTSTPNPQAWVKTLDDLLIPEGMGEVIQTEPPYPPCYAQGFDFTFEVRVYGDDAVLREVRAIMTTMQPPAEVVRARSNPN